jgi:radical SAM protein with 4Fe4S-binding SPASM domain
VINTIQSLQKMGVEHVAVNSIIRSGKGKDAKGIPVKELEKILIKGRELGLETGTEFRWYSPTHYCKLNPMELGLGLKQCSACRLNMAVEPDGNVIPCQSYYEGMGNITKDSWTSIWNNDLCTGIRERKELPKECEGCDLQAVCGGGCPLSWSKGDYLCQNVLSS